MCTLYMHSITCFLSGVRVAHYSSSHPGMVATTIMLISGVGTSATMLHRVARWTVSYIGVNRNHTIYGCFRFLVSYYDPFFYRPNYGPVTENFVVTSILASLTYLTRRCYNGSISGMYMYWNWTLKLFVSFAIIDMCLSKGFVSQPVMERTQAVRASGPQYRDAASFCAMGAVHAGGRT